jgi:hypothetical protein
MLNPKICREQASKCTQTAETFPPGEQRQRFLDMAEDWTRLADSVEGLEARFGSRIDAQQSLTAKREEEAAHDGDTGLQLMRREAQRDRL